MPEKPSRFALARGLHRSPFVRTAILLAITAAFLSGGVALAWDLAVETDEERVMDVVQSVVEARDESRGEAALHAVSLESHPLEVSGPGVEHVYDAADRAPLADLVSEVEDLLEGAELSILQSEITVHADSAHVVLNVEIAHGEETSFLPMDLDLRRLGDSFVVTRVRLHR